MNSYMPLGHDTGLAKWIPLAIAVSIGALLGLGMGIASAEGTSFYAVSAAKSVPAVLTQAIQRELPITAAPSHAAPSGQMATRMFPEEEQAQPHFQLGARLASLALIPLAAAVGFLLGSQKSSSQTMTNELVDIVIDDEESEICEEASWALAATVGQVTSRRTAVVPVKDASGSTVGSAELSLKTAGVNSRHVIHRKLVAELANRRQSNAHTKTRAEVSGGGKKPYKQKGTGNARRGSSRSPLMRHGGVAFGPRNTKNYKQKINKKEGRLAISSLIQNRAPLITVIKDMEDSMNVISTKKAAQMVESWKDTAKGNNVLLVIDAPNGEVPPHNPLVMSTNNIPLVRLMNQRMLCVNDLLWPHQIFVSDKALAALKLRFEAAESSEDSVGTEAVAV